ncbi:phage replisome organizer protein [Enterococcus faecium 13.SD.W.09]|nr:phage replisome organizer protein [Enterococcus faecium 13.SD.W.09]
MSDKRKKRYFWLRLKEDFFEEDTIEWLEEQPNGKEYCLIYLKLCLKSLKTEGLLVRNVGKTMIPYDAEALAKTTNSSVDTIKVAMDLFQKIGLIEVMETGEIYLSQLNELVGSETEAAAVKRLERSRKASATLSQNCLSDCHSNVAQSIEYRDKSIENRDKEKKPRKRQKRVYESTSIYFILAQELFQQICQNQEIKEPNVQQWADDIRKMIEIDKRTEDQVRRMISWSQKHSFWSANILSARKLREKYDTMAAQAKRDQTKQSYSKPPIRKEPVPEWFEDPEGYNAQKEAELQQGIDDLPF